MATYFDISSLPTVNEVDQNKVEEIKKFLEVDELSKLEQGALQGGQAEGKQKIQQRQRNEDDGTATVGGPTQN